MTITDKFKHVFNGFTDNGFTDSNGFTDNGFTDRTRSHDRGSEQYKSSWFGGL